MNEKKNDLGEVVIYRAKDGKTALDVHLHEETVWLNQYQLAELFGRERSVVTKHIRNIFAEGELKPKAVCAKFAQTGPDGKVYQVDHYNLDLIISVGYRVKSREGVRFRQWATQTLKDHLIRGYTLNERRLRERGIEMEQAVQLLSRTLTRHNLVKEEGRGVRLGRVDSCPAIEPGQGARRGLQPDPDALCDRALSLSSVPYAGARDLSNLYIEG
jgi:hypothetical protein